MSRQETGLPVIGGFTRCTTCVPLPFGDLRSATRLEADLCPGAILSPRNVHEPQSNGALNRMLKRQFQTDSINTSPRPTDCIATKGETTHMTPWLGMFASERHVPTNNGSSRNTRTTPRLSPSESTIGAPLSAMGRSVPSLEISAVWFARLMTFCSRRILATGLSAGSRVLSFTMSNTIIANSTVGVFGAYDGATLTCCDLHGNTGGDWVGGLAGLDPLEVEIPETGDYEFLDSESNAKLRTTSDNFHKYHRETVAKWRKSLQLAAIGAGCRWDSVTTEESLVATLSRMLQKI